MIASAGASPRASRVRTVRNASATGALPHLVHDLGRLR